MPEGPEITVLSQYLLSKLKGRTFEKFVIFDNKYENIKLDSSYDVKDISSKGKLLWITLQKGTITKYFTSHLGLAGEWSFSKSKNDKLRIVVGNKNNNKKYNLCYQDKRGFGKIEIISDITKKTLLLADDALKTDFSDSDFVDMVNEFLTVSKKRQHQNIFKVLMKQTKKDGIVSGLGNYLTPEILYDCKISPFREIGSLKKEELLDLGHSIRHVIKLSYYNNITGYMTNFGDFIKVHKERIDNGTYPEYHKNIKLKKNENFQFKVYRQKKDPLGNPVEADRSINKTRTVYWVPKIQC